MSRVGRRTPSRYPERYPERYPSRSPSRSLSRSPSKSSSRSPERRVKRRASRRYVAGGESAPPIDIHMRDYRRQAVERIVSRCIKQHGMVLAHTFGTGKTLTIGVLLKNFPSNWKKLLLAPTDVHEQWQKVSDSLDLGLEIIDIYGPIPHAEPREVMIVDEAHLLIPQVNTPLVKRFGQSTKLVLATGTPFVEDAASLHVLVNLAAGKPVLPSDPNEFTKKYMYISPASAALFGWILPMGEKLFRFGIVGRGGIFSVIAGMLLITRKLNKDIRSTVPASEEKLKYNKELIPILEARVGEYQDTVEKLQEELDELVSVERSVIERKNASNQSKRSAGQLASKDEKTDTQEIINNAYHGTPIHTKNRELERAQASLADDTSHLQRAQQKTPRLETEVQRQKSLTFEQLLREESPQLKNMTELHKRIVLDATAELKRINDHIENEKKAGRGAPLEEEYGLIAQAQLKGALNVSRFLVYLLDEKLPRLNIIEMKLVVFMLASLLWKLAYLLTADARRDLRTLDVNKLSKDVAPYLLIFDPFQSNDKDILKHFPIATDRVEYTTLDSYQLLQLQRMANNKLDYELLKTMQFVKNPEEMAGYVQRLAEQQKQMEDLGRMASNLAPKGQVPEKFDLIFEMHEKDPVPTVVYSNFERGMELFLEAVKEHTKFKAEIYTKRSQLQRALDGEVDFLVLPPQSTQGVDLPGMGRMHILEPLLNAATFSQLRARVIRYVHDATVRNKVEIIQWVAKLPAAGWINHKAMSAIFQYWGEYESSLMPTETFAKVVLTAPDEIVHARLQKILVEFHEVESLLFRASQKAVFPDVQCCVWKTPGAEREQCQLETCAEFWSRYEPPRARTNPAREESEDEEPDEEDEEPDREPRKKIPRSNAFKKTKPLITE